MILFWKVLVFGENMYWRIQNQPPTKHLRRLRHPAPPFPQTLLISKSPLFHSMNTNVYHLLFRTNIKRPTYYEVPTYTSLSTSLQQALTKKFHFPCFPPIFPKIPSWALILPNINLLLTDLLKIRSSPVCISPGA